MYHKILADGIFAVSSICVLAAMAGWLVEDVWLASTQWMLLAIFLLLVAIFVKMNTQEDEKLIKDYAKRRKNGGAK
ncbi:MAG: hypothetical protein PHQ20_02745 [Candidatus Moranbacteria bacterium]|jgi:hypothetical protein|nr:hypothetical protein [Candidatus Moranbacteria bacterium]